KLSEEAQEAEDLRKRLEVVGDEDDDVFVDATPLAQKVPVVDYQIMDKMLYGEIKRVFSTTIPAASATIPAAKPTIPTAALTVVVAYTRRRKGVIIRDPEEELHLKTPA
nr:hypothetical protein [Tanacetum cinerariifolium]